MIPALGHQPITVAGKQPTCTLNGMTDAIVCAVCGEVLADSEMIPANGHSWEKVDRTAAYTLYKCIVCGESLYVRNDVPMVNLYGSIVFDATMKPVDYTVVADSADESKICITADLSKKEAKGYTDEIGLFINRALLNTLKNDGVKTIVYEQGGAVLEISVDAISNDWFAVEPQRVIFWTNPNYVTANGAQGVQVKIEGKDANGDAVEGDGFTGVYVVFENGRQAVTTNGVYLPN